MHQKNSLNEREFELINIVGAQLANNQRDLSEHMDLSLGTINMLLKRLVSKGYIRIRQLNAKKVQYILTPKGFSEKMEKSVKYTKKTLQSIGLIRDNINLLIKELYAKGYRNFYILGQSDLALLIEIVFKELVYKDFILEYIDTEKFSGEGVLLVCRENIDLTEYQFSYSIDLIKELAKRQIFIH